MKLFKRTLSLIVAAIMIATTFLFTNIGMLFPKAYNTYNLSKYSTYYYAPSSGYNYICETALYFSSSSNSDAEGMLTGNGYTPVGINFNAGDGHASKYVHMGVKYNTSPSAGAKAFRAYVNSTGTDQYTVTSAINGNSNVTFYAVGSGTSSLTPNVLDGVLELNKGNGGDYVYLYTTASALAGPPITQIGMANNSNSATASSYLTNEGYTIATRFDNVSTAADFNSGAGGDCVYFGYKTTIPTVSVSALTSLNTAYNQAVSAYTNNSTLYANTNMASAINTASNILNDYVADSWSSSFTETQIISAANNLTGIMSSVAVADVCNISKYSTYYYAPSSGYNYISSMAMYYSNKSNSRAEEGLTNAGYTPVGLNFNQGDSCNSDYIHLGVKYSTNPSGTATAFRVLVNSSASGQLTRASEINGNSNVPFYAVGSGASNLTPNVLDGMVDLNKDAGGDTLYLYASNSALAGPPITQVLMVNSSNSSAVVNELTSGGYTIATRFDNVAANIDLNLGCGGDYLYLGYKTTIPTVTDAVNRLGSVYNCAIDCYQNGGSNYSGLSSALNTARAILDDYTEDSWSATYTEAQINAAAKALMESLPAMSIGTAYGLATTGATRRLFRFIPSETGNYMFFTGGTDNNVDPRIHILNADTTYGADLRYGFSATSGYNILTYNDDIGLPRSNILGVSTYQSAAVATLTANTVYYIDVYLSKAISGLPFRVHKAVDVTFSSTGGTGDKTLTLPAGYNTMKMNQIGVSRTNHSLIAWSIESNGAMNKTCLASSAISVPTIPTTYFALWNPTNSAGYTTAALNTEYTADIAAKGQMVFYYFKPTETAKYVIYSTSTSEETMTADPFVIVWERSALASDPDNRVLYNDDGDQPLRNALGGNTGASPRNFAVEATFNANTEYIIGAKTFHGSTGSGGNANTSGQNSGIGPVKFKIERVFTVSYNVLGGTGTLEAQSKYYGRALTLTSTQPTRAGYAFAGWTTTSSGSGTVYPAGGTIDFNSDVTLYAKWVASNYNISYNLNGGTVSGANPTSYTTTSSPVQLINPTRPGYTFAGWTGTNLATPTTDAGAPNVVSSGLSQYTKANPYSAAARDHHFGNSFDVTPGETYRVFVTAKRTAGELDMQGGIWYTSYTAGLPYDAFNGAFTYVGDAGDGWGVYYKDVTVPAGKTAGQFYIMLNQSISDPTTTWQLANCFVTLYAPGNLTYTANWTPNIYKATLNPQGADTMGTTAFWYKFNTVTNGVYYYADSACTTPLGNGSSITTPTRTGYAFNGYYTVVGGNGTKYIDADGKCINNLYSAFPQNITLYAKWTANSYKVAFDANGASSAPSPANITVTYGAVYPTMPTVVRTGYTFAGWFTAATGGTQISAGQIVGSRNERIMASTPTAANGVAYTLYAHWIQDTAEYKVCRYVESVNGTFNETAEFCTGVIGMTVTAEPNDVPTGFTLDATRSVLSGVIAADGSLVLKLYYVRNTYNLVLKPGSGTGGDYTRTVKFGETVKLPSAESLGYSVSGKVFAGWAANLMQADFGIHVYDDQADLTIGASNVTLYAVYREPIKELRDDGRFYIEGVAVPAYYGLVEYEGDFYYVKDRGLIVKNTACYVNTTNGLTFADGSPIQKGSYIFDEDGKMVILQGLQDDDKYYVNGLAVPAYYGLIEWEGELYYIKDNAKIVRSRTCYINTTNGLTLPNGNPVQRTYYEFDADGKLVVKQGIQSDDKYYIDGVAVAAYYGLVEWDGDFYYIKDNAKIVRSKVCYVNTTNDLTFPDGSPVQRANYEFDADGKLMIKQGIQSDGKYYINGLAVPAYYGLVEWGDDYYYVKDNGMIVKNVNCYVRTTNDLTFPNGDPIPRGYYDFDAEGKMVIKQGLQADGKYYINGVAVPSYYGLVEDGGYYYYIKDNAQIVRNNTIRVNTTNGLTFPDGTPIQKGNYTFGADGRMVY